VSSRNTIFSTVSGRQTTNGFEQLIFEIEQGTLQIDLIAAGGVVVQKINRHFGPSIGSQRSGKKVHLPEGSAALTDSEVHHTQTTTGEGTPQGISGCP
jgi:hypothetical protein